VYRLALCFYNLIPQLQRSRIFEIYGFSEMPEPETEIQSDNGPLWHWFLLNIMPLDENLKYKFINKTSLSVRLNLLKKIVLLLLAPHMSSFNNNASSSAVGGGQSQSSGESFGGSQSTTDSDTPANPADQSNNNSSQQDRDSNPQNQNSQAALMAASLLWHISLHDLLFQNQLLLNENLEWELRSESRVASRREHSPLAANRAASRAEVRTRQDRRARRMFNICSVFVLLFASLVPVTTLLVFNRLFVYLSN
jgi:hypothetical protein